MKTIVNREAPVLRQKTEIVPIKEILSSRIRKIIADMKEALAPQKDGVALAAPQIGIPLRIFVISGHAFDPKALLHNNKLKKKYEDIVFINPEIVKLSKEKEWVPEGCLSVRWLYGEVKRSKKAVVRAYDERGKVFTRGGTGLLAQIFQHEIDHLNGVLFIDKARYVEELPPERQPGPNQTNIMTKAK